MDRASHSDDLPPLYAQWASEFLSGPIPAETEATCSNCAMLAGEGEAHPPHATPFFNPDTKCCTYLPVLLYVTSGTSWFGRARSMRCPHYIDEGGGQCGVWRHRAAVCATWFCKHARGAVGQRFWQTLHRLLSAVERELSLWCALELGVGSSAIQRCLNERKLLHLDQTISMASRATTLRRAFGDWSGREHDYVRSLVGRSHAAPRRKLVTTQRPPTPLVGRRRRRRRAGRSRTHDRRGGFDSVPGGGSRG